MSDYPEKKSYATLITDWLNAGFEGLIPIAPPTARLHEHSRIDPAQLGKVPSDFYGGFWDTMGGWQRYEMTPENAQRWDQLQANVGLKMGVRYCALDVDVTDDLLAQAMLQDCMAISNNTWPIRWGLRPKFLILFAVAEGETIRRRQYPITKDGVTMKVEVMGLTASQTETQAVVGGQHPSGSMYEWSMPVRPETLAVVTAAQMDGLVERMVQIAESRGWKRGKPVGTGDGAATASDLGAQPFNPSLVAPIVNLVPNPDLEYDAWIGVGYAIKASLGGQGAELWHQWSARSNKYDQRATQRAWDSFNPDGSIGIGRLVYLARQANGGKLPDDLEHEVRISRKLQEATVAGLNVTPVTGGAPVTETDLLFDEKGGIVANFANVCAFMEESDIWRGVFRMNRFTRKHMVCKQPEGGYIDADRVGKVLGDEDYASVHRWFQKHMFSKISRTDVIHAIEYISEQNSFDPLQDYLNGLVWDGVPRIGSWLVQYCGVVEWDPMRAMYTSEVGRKWLIGAVARALSPGCKMDNALVFEGAQGLGKSSALAALCPDPKWFGDSLPDFHTKDASEYLSGKWIVEMAELTQFRKSEVEQMRAFLTRTFENYRPSYGRNVIERDRQCVFAGSTNRDDYLQDTQGERRIWPVKVTNAFDLRGLKRDRDQLWAEAVHAFKAGEVWYLTQKSETVARQVQKDKVERDPWADVLESHFDMTARNGGPRVTEITLAEGLSIIGKSTDSRSTVSQRQMRKALEQIGFRRGGRKGPTKARHWIRD